MAHRVAVTGVGVISAFGRGAEAFWQGLSTGTSGIRPLQAMDPAELRFGQGAEVPDLDPSGEIAREVLHISDRFAWMALLAARDAVADAGLSAADVAGTGTAVATGSCLGGQGVQDVEYERLFGERRSRLHPLTIPRVMANSGASLISMDLGIEGPGFTLSTACSSANHALGQALWLLRSGAAERAIAGGSEAPFTRANLLAWSALRVVSPDTCRPFSADRDGMILGEGAGMLMLETLEAARARGARIYAELAGCGMSCDAHHVTQPSERGPAAALSAALADAGLAPEQIGYVNAHGTGTDANDPTECAALRRVFGAHAERLAVSSTKSMHGHALGAAGALEGVATALALYHGLLPPTANFTRPDPACDLDVVPNDPRTAEVEAALSSSFAFGGLNAVLALRRV
ncbi:MAG: beta-ketoacyl-[acyl-carrier-protein] synthase family protein [Thermoanaerobaculia bacterium]|nr:beta-ketoacyl-[acyl-carrier-protein] synthase family protein [Thermoanaerobaculia bacterium]